MAKGQDSGAPGPLVSFVLPCYNLPTALVRECLGSILSLPLAPSEREIILVDDGSDVPVIDGLGDLARQVLYLRQANQGLSVSRNNGVDASSGEYIQFVDGDDALFPAPYSRCLDIVRRHRPDMVLFAASGDAAPRDRASDPVVTDGVTHMAGSNIHAAAWGYVFRREILGDLRFTPGILHEDEEFTPQLLLRARTLWVTRDVAYFYREREGSIMSDVHARKVAKRLSDMESVIARLRDRAACLPPAEARALSRRVAQLTMDHIVNVVRLTRSRRQLSRHIGRLRRLGLFPLPRAGYTTSYVVFRTIVNNDAFRGLLARLALR